MALPLDKLGTGRGSATTALGDAAGGAGARTGPG